MEKMSTFAFSKPMEEKVDLYGMIGKIRTSFFYTEKNLRETVARNLNAYNSIVPLALGFCV